MNARNLLATAAAAAIYGCGSDAERQSAERPSAESAAETSAGGQESGSSASAAGEATAIPGSCDLIPRAEVERIAGQPLQGEPERDGKGCWYYVVVDTLSAEWKQLRERGERARAAGMDDRAIELYHPTRAGLYVEVDVEAAGERSDTALPGWDETRISRTGAVFSGRAGHVKVFLRLQQLRAPADTVVAIANRVRDRIPDGPIAHPAADRSGQPSPGRDPCSVLTPGEAEPVLGKLVVQPFRTRERTPLADPTGESCAYLTAGHRVLLLTPVWEYGGLELEAARMGGGMVRQLVSRVADLRGIEGDTLEGQWDDAVVDLEGELLVLKGAHALGIRYRASSTDAAGAIRLSGPALQRLDK
jgi:hypothetical protein